MLPQASVYPAYMRATRDLLRRRMHLAHKRAALLAHVQHTNSQYNLPAIGKKIAWPSSWRVPSITCSYARWLSMGRCSSSDKGGERMSLVPHWTPMG